MYDSRRGGGRTNFETNVKNVHTKKKKIENDEI